MQPPQTSGRPAPAAEPRAADGQRDSVTDLKMKDALRIQVAAVAAQQAALLDEEARLQEQQRALAQQQDQLAAHLDEKRQRLLQLHEQIQTARADLVHQRQEHAASALQQAQELAEGKAELEKGLKRLLKDRARVKRLRRRLKNHFARNLAAERKQLRNREAAVSDQHHQIEKEAKKLQHDREILAQNRTTFNADMELAKRQLNDEWQELRQQQQLSQHERDRQQTELDARARANQQHVQDLTDAERALADDQYAWQQKRSIAEREIQGLENRIVNLRRKLDEGGGGRGSGEGGSKALPSTPAAPPSNVYSHVPQQAVVGDPAAAELHHVADELADQRLQLAEHWLRLATIYQEWDQARNLAADELTALARGFPEKEQALLARQAALETAEAELRERRKELTRYRNHLEAWAARVRVREATWMGERDRVLADLQGREASVEKHLHALVELRKSWVKRRRQELEQLTKERALSGKQRQEAAVLRQECLKRGLSLEQQHWELAAKTTAMEEYRQQFVLRSADAAGVENKLQRLQARWTKHNAAAMQATDHEFERLQAEADDLQKRGSELLDIAEELTTREANLAERQSALQAVQLQTEGQQTDLQQQLRSALIQRDRSQREIAELQSEVDRLARLLLDEGEGEAATIPSATAA